MNYKFEILTTEGIKESLVESNFDFTFAPFGYVPYRFISTSDCSQEILQEFWRCVDIVLTNHNLKSNDFIRALRATSEKNVFGEVVISEVQMDALLTTHIPRQEDIWAVNPEVQI